MTLAIEVENSLLRRGDWLLGMRIPRMPHIHPCDLFFSVRPITSPPMEYEANSASFFVRSWRMGNTNSSLDLGY